MHNFVAEHSQTSAQGNQSQVSALSNFTRPFEFSRSVGHVPMFNGAVSPVGASAEQPIQMLRQFAHEPKAGTQYGYGGQRDLLLQGLKSSVAGLGDDATHDEAKNSMSEAFYTHHAKPDNHTIHFDGNNVFLRNQHGRNVDKLGTLSHDQDPALYRQTAADPSDKNELHVNISDGKHYVKDANGLYTPRFQTRSITKSGGGQEFDFEKLKKRTDIVGAAPNSGANPLEHVGGKDTAYISLTKGAGDVTNAQGVPFNAGNKGRITTDLLQVPQGSIVDVSSERGAEAALKPHLGEAAKEKWASHWAEAGKKEEAVRKAKYSVTSHTVATKAKPDTTLTGQQWQGLLDARRTKEVLVHGSLPFESVTSFGNASEDLPEQANKEIAEHKTASDLRSTAAQQTLDAYDNDTQAPLHQDMAMEFRVGRNQLNRTVRTHVQNRIGAMPEKDRQGFKQGAHNMAIASLEELANSHQNRLTTGIHQNPAAAVAAFRAARLRLQARYPA